MNYGGPCIVYITQLLLSQTVATMQLVTMFVKGVPPIIFALFIGPWSDRFGRKFLIIFPLFGDVIYCLWFLINVIFFDQLGERIKGLTAKGRL